MIVTARAPTRISLFGGGTDLAPYYNLYGGMTLSLTINFWEEVTLYTDDNLFDVSDHQFPQDADPQLIYEILKEFGVNGTHTCRVHTAFRGVIGAGLGSSAAVGVALIAALLRWRNKYLYRREIAELAWDIETKRLGWYGGKQDQYAAAFAGFNLFLYDKDGVGTSHLPSTWVDMIYPFMMLFYLGGKRESRSIQQGFQQLTKEKTRALHAMKGIVNKALNYLYEEQTLPFLRLFDEAWQLKKTSSPGATTNVIDNAYQCVKEHGAYGGKIMGAGGCGYMLVVAPPDKQERIIVEMEKQGFDHILFYPVDEGVIVREE